MILGWVRKVLFRQPDGPPTDERSIKEQLLEQKAREVRAQTQRLSRIRLEAQAAQQRVNRR